MVKFVRVALATCLILMMSGATAYAEEAAAHGPDALCGQRPVVVETGTLAPGTPAQAGLVF